MKLIQLDVVAFGTIKNRQFLFPDGFSIAYGENEQGKSTLMTCLKAMFYGFSGRSRSLLDNDRLRCQPWDGSRIQASLVFSHQNSRYRLQRTFGKTKAQDETVLMNEISGATIPVPSSQEIGPFLLQIPSQEFTNTVFIGQMNSVITDPDDSTLAKLLNLSSTLNETLSSQAIDSRLQKAQVRLRAERGGGGLIPQLEQQLAQLTVSREQAVASEASQQQRSHQLRAYEQQRQVLQQTRDRLSDQLLGFELDRRQANLARLAERQAKLLELANKEQNLKAQLVAAAIDEARLSDWRSELQSLKQARLTLLQQVRDFSKAQETALTEAAAVSWRHYAAQTQQIEILTAALNQIEPVPGVTPPTPARQPVPVGWHVLAFGLSLTGILLGLWVRPVFFAGAVTAVLAWLLGITWHARRQHPAKGKTTTPQGVPDFSLDRSQQRQDLENQLAMARAQADQAAREAQQAQANLENWHDETAADDAQLPSELTLLTDGLMDHWLQLQQHIQIALAPDPWLDTSSDAVSEATTIQAALQALDPDILQQGLDLLSAKIATWHHQRDLHQQFAQTFALDLEGLSWEAFLTREQKEIAAGRQKIRPIAIIDSATVDSATVDTATVDSAIVDSATVDTAPALRVPDADLDTVQSQLQDVKDQLEQIERTIAGTESAILHTPRPKQQVADCDREIADLHSRLTQARDDHASLVLARTLVQKAYEELQATFGPRLNQDTAAILQRLTATRFDAVKVDKTFSVQVAAPSEQHFHDWRYYSGGTIDQIYLALRLAVAGLIQTSAEPMPLLLDDTLVQYDDPRTAAAVAYLAERASQTGGQIILLTSQSRLKEIAGQISPAITVKNLG